MSVFFKILAERKQMYVKTGKRKFTGEKEKNLGKLTVG